MVELTPASQTTVLTTLPYYIHQGMIFVPPGYQSQEVSNVKVVHGASPYGSSTIAGGDGSLQPQAQDLAAAEFQGKVGLSFFLWSLTDACYSTLLAFVTALKKGRAAA